MVLKNIKGLKIFSVVLILVFASCDQIYLVNSYDDDEIEVKQVTEGNVKVYFDGQLIGAITTDETLIGLSPSSFGFSFGVPVDNEYFHSTTPDLFDEFLIYNRCLESGEIESLYNNPGDLLSNETDMGG